MKVEVKLQGADGFIKMLQSLPAEIVSKRGGPVKLALAKAARLVRDEARKNLQASIKGTDDAESTGLLLENLISSRGKQPSGGKGERYLVRVRRKAYPGRKPEKDGTVATTRKTAQIKEYGSSKQPATPWLRPAVRSKGEEAINVMTSDLGKRIERIAAKLAKEKGMK